MADLQPQASFIPKRPITAGAGRPIGHSGILWGVAVFVFLVSTFTAGAVFSYEKYLQGLLVSQQEQLAKARAAFDPGAIADLVRLDTRINLAKTLLKRHLNPSEIFSLLQQTTLQTVRFNEFSYAYESTGITKLSLKGEALDFSSVALQSDALGANKAFRDVLFSDLSIDQTSGRISFSVSAIIDASYLQYANAFTRTATSTPRSTP